MDETTIHTEEPIDTIAPDQDEGFSREFVEMMIQDKKYHPFVKGAMLGDLEMVKLAFAEGHTYPAELDCVETTTPLQIAASSPPYYRLITYFCLHGANAEMELSLEQLDNILIRVAVSMSTFGEDEEEYMIRLKLNVIRIETVKLSAYYFAGKVSEGDLRLGLASLQEQRELLETENPSMYQLIEKELEEEEGDIEENENTESS